MPTRQRIADLVRLLNALARFLTDIALFAGTIAALWGGLAWLGFAVDRVLGTAPRGHALVGQAGPFAMLGLVTGCVSSFYAINWIVTRAHRKR